MKSLEREDVMVVIGRASGDLVREKGGDPGLSCEASHFLLFRGIRWYHGRESSSASMW